MVLTVLITLVMVGLWTLERLDLLPDSHVRTWLARAAILPVVLTAFAAPAALQKGIEWYVERKTNEVMERFEPVLEDLRPGEHVQQEPIVRDVVQR